MAHVKTELLKRLRKASDWLVSTACPPPSALPQLVGLAEPCEYMPLPACVKPAKRPDL